MIDDRCAAHDIDGLQCERSWGHPARHSSTDRQGREWLWSIDHGPVQKTVLEAS